MPNTGDAATMGRDPFSEQGVSSKELADCLRPWLLGLVVPRKRVPWPDLDAPVRPAESSHRLLSNLAGGASTLTEVLGSSPPDSPGVLESLLRHSEMEALRGDWRRVGCDLARAIKQYAKVSAEEPDDGGAREE
jgi:hypothetical protein